MRIAITGTPGVGKTTVSKLLAGRLGYEYTSVKDFAVEHGIGEMVGDEIEIDVDELAEVMDETIGKNVVIDGHLSHYVPVDFVIVLRADPKIVAQRLIERDYLKKKVGENVEAELIDEILVEALEENENVIEVDTTGKTPEEIVEEIVHLLEGGVKRRVGIVDWSDRFDDIVEYLRR